MPILTSSSGATDNVNTNLIWQVWNVAHTSTLTTSASTSTIVDLTWTAWNSQIVTVSSGSSLSTNTISMTSAATTWTAWNQVLSTVRDATPEQVAEAQRRAQTYRERELVIQAERVAAKDRAERLLREALNPKQREELQQKGHFTLETIAVSGERRTYRIRRGRSRNVEQIDASSGRVLKTLCAHPVALVPDADTMLAQKLMLEASEDDFLRIANHS